MILVMPCAGSKYKDAGSFKYNNKKVIFVSNPKLIPEDDNYIYAHPDDICKNINTSYRTMLTEYNYIYENTGENPLNLLPAYKLYKPKIYSDLYNHYGNKLYILSAGWGIIKSDYLIPYYNITFSNNGDDNAIRNKHIIFNDYNQLLQSIICDDIYSFNISKYSDFFINLTKNITRDKYLYCRNKIDNDIKNINMIPFDVGKQSTNWHYTVAKSLLK